MGSQIPEFHMLLPKAYGGQLMLMQLGLPLGWARKKDKMVKFITPGTIPHLIVSFTKSAGIQHKCDERCPHYKSIGVCAHIVAVAETNSELN